MSFIKHLVPAVMMTLVLTLLTGVAYPLIVTGLAKLIFPAKAEGSLIVRDGAVVGSRLIGQPFRGDMYFHSRPSAAGAVGYDAGASGGTNLGPTSRKLIESQVKPAVEAYRVESPDRPVPVDLVTSSASGLDPHITPAAAEYQVPRVARARKVSEEAVRQLVAKHTEGRTFGVLGEPRVNVLELNLELDSLSSAPRER